jgi:hypothetical protein
LCEFPIGTHFLDRGYGPFDPRHAACYDSALATFGRYKVCESLMTNLKRLIVGQPLATEQLAH